SSRAGDLIYTRRCVAAEAAYRSGRRDRLVRLRQGLILGAGRPNTKAGNHSPRGHPLPQLDTCKTTQAVAPADIRQAWQPAGATTLGLASRYPGAVEAYRRSAGPPGGGRDTAKTPRGS